MDDIKLQVNKIIQRIREMEDHYGRSINEKTIFRRAGKVVKDTMIQEAPKDTGRLRQSIDFLNFRRDKRGLRVGARYFSQVDESGNNLKPTGRHAHLVELGFDLRNGERFPKNEFVRRTYDKTKYQTLQNLEKELAKVQKRFERSL